MDGVKERRFNDSSHLSQYEVVELIERFVKEKGWYVPTLHEKYLEKYVIVNNAHTKG